MHEKIIALGEKIHDAIKEYVAKNDESAITDDLCGACAIGSHLLVKEINRKLGLEARFACAKGHAWVECQDRIYDLTATQFGYPGKIRVMSLKDVKAFAHKSDGKNRRGGYYHYLLEVYGYGLNEVNKEWPHHQRPDMYELKWINQHKARLIAKQ